MFIFYVCSRLKNVKSIDKKDLISFFQELRLYYGKDFLNNIEILHEVEKIFENNNISKLDIKRMYRYLDKNVKKDVIVEDDSMSEEDE